MSQPYGDQRYAPYGRHHEESESVPAWAQAQQPAPFPPPSRQQPGWQDPPQDWRQFPADPLPAPPQQQWIPQQPAAAAPLWAEPIEEEPAAPAELPPSVRGAVVHRAITANAGHAQYGADLAGGANDPAEHMLMLFSSDGRPAYPDLSLATRFELSGEHNADMHELLDGLTAVAETRIRAAHAQGLRWDPREVGNGLVTRSENLADRSYVGVGVSTLDQPQLPWSRIKYSMDRYQAAELSGQVYLYLEDGTAVHIVRAPMMGPMARQHQVLSTHTLDGLGYPFRHTPRLVEQAPDKYTYGIWTRLHRLNEVLTRLPEALSGS